MDKVLKWFFKGNAFFWKSFSKDQETEALGRPAGTSDTPRAASYLLRVRSKCFAVLWDQKTEAPGRPSGMDDTHRVTNYFLRLRSMWFCWCLWLWFEVLAGLRGEKDSGCFGH